MIVLQKLVGIFYWDWKVVAFCQPLQLCILVVVPHPPRTGRLPPPLRNLQKYQSLVHQHTRRVFIRYQESPGFQVMLSGHQGYMSPIVIFPIFNKVGEKVGD